METQRAPRRLALVLISAGLFAVGLLLILEVVRPFRDLNIDGPIAMACWFIGAALGGVSFFLRRTHAAFGALAFLLNIGALIVMSAILFLLSQSHRMF